MKAQALSLEGETSLTSLAPHEYVMTFKLERNIC